MSIVTVETKSLLRVDSPDERLGSESLSSYPDVRSPCFLEMDDIILSVILSLTVALRGRSMAMPKPNYSRYCGDSLFALLSCASTDTCRVLSSSSSINGLVELMLWFIKIASCASIVPKFPL